jgi:hypothetical protein
MKAHEQAFLKEKQLLAPTCELSISLRTSFHRLTAYYFSLKTFGQYY